MEATGDAIRAWTRGHDGCPTGAYVPRRPEEGVLHRTLREHFETFLAKAKARNDGDGLPMFVERELREFLSCGVLARGFARFRCDGCGHETLVAFSCKGRGFCPSCCGRRMAELAAHLTDHVLGGLPVRQWVLTLPHRLRYALAWDHDLCRAVLAVFTRSLLGFERHRAARRGVREAAGELLDAARWSRRAAEWASMRDPRESLRLWQKTRALLGGGENSVEARDLGFRACVGILSWGWRIGMPEDGTATEGRTLATPGDRRLLVGLLCAYSAYRGFTGDLEAYLHLSIEGTAIADEIGEAPLRLLARTSLGWSRIQRGELPAALAVYDRAVEISESHPSAYAPVLGLVRQVLIVMQRGVVLSEIGRLEDAEKDFGKSAANGIERAAHGRPVAHRRDRRPELPAVHSHRACRARASQKRPFGAGPRARRSPPSVPRDRRAAAGRMGRARGRLVINFTCVHPNPAAAKYRLRDLVWHEVQGSARANGASEYSVEDSPS